MPPNHPAFDPEPVTPDDIAAWTRDVEAELVRTLDQFEAGRAALPESQRAIAAELLAARVRLLDYVGALVPSGTGGTKTRYHGDFHLGQVLVVESDFVITDFEGEPARTPAARRAKHSPLRDVAGMVRSFDYARAVALERYGQTHPADASRAASLLRAWAQEAAATFRLAYDEVQAQRADALIELFVLEKALYELRYEQDHRPEWVGIPLAALHQLAHQLDGEPS